MTTTDITMVIMSRDEARALTDEVKADAHALWAKLLTLYRADAHKLLDYRTWGQYYEAEFGGSVSRANQLLAAGRVLESLEPAGFHGESSPGSPLLNERAARELQPLLRNGAHVVREAYEEAVEMAGGEKPTATQVREVVQLRRDPKPEPPEPPLTPPTPIRAVQPAPVIEAPEIEQEPAQAHVEEPEPAWVAELTVLVETFASNAMWFQSGSHCGPEVIAAGARGLIGELEIVKAFLEKLAAE